VGGKEAKMIQEALAKVVQKIDLQESEMTQVMTEVMEGKATPAQLGGFLAALRMKGETVEEVTGAARIMRQKATRIDARSSVIVDTCGTGGDGRKTFNISTTAAFVAAAAGLTVAKHGNRSVSSSCGSADVLEALGVNIEVPPEVVEECLQQIGIGFLFAPRMHGAMKYTVGPRRELGLRTIFNMLGPLTNPAGATAQLIGVYDPKLTEMFAGVLRNLGTKKAFIVHGADGLDEATVTGETRVTELEEGRITTYNLDPVDYFGEVFGGEALTGGDAAANAQITREILAGTDGSRRKIVVLNSALAIVAGGKAETVREGIRVAEECLDSGAARKKLEGLVELTHS
jgi:anthranilate phosphoribosyltransferase